MKRIFSLFVFLAACWLVPHFVYAESITSFDSQIHIKSDSTFTVVERISYDFGDVARHGIYRDIPFHYNARGGNFNIRIDVNSVTDEIGNSYPFTISRDGEYVHVKIGDANQTITGLHTYVITYSVGRAINYFSDHDELYWNVTGNQWQVPMQNVTAEVFFPEGIDSNALQFQCFTGNVGSTLECGKKSLVSNSAGLAQEADFTAGAVLAGQNMTIVVGFPKYVVTKPTFWQNARDVIVDNGILGLPAIVFVFMFWLWDKKGRDPKGKTTIVPQYEAPAGLTPTEVGTIVDEKADNQDVSAELINLAVKGYLKITRLEKKIIFFNVTDYQLDMLKDGKDLPNTFQRELMDGLFLNGLPNVALSQLKNTFYKHLEEIKKQVYQAVVLKGYFDKNPNTTRGAYAAGGVVVIFLSFFFGFAISVFTGLAMILSGIIVLAFSPFMPNRTIKGAQAKAQILGLKMYLSVAEKERLKFFNAPDKTPEIFEKLLPYAMVLGVEKEWAKQFEGIYKNPPAWYSDPSGHAFTTGYLIGSLNNFSTTANTDFASTPRSASGGGGGFGGGGFSGGGYGGGGGGSW